MQNVSQEQWICSVLVSSFLRAFSKCKLETKPKESEILEHMLIAEIWDVCSECLSVRLALMWALRICIARLE